jgi:signal transduction histidine kinase
MLLTDQGQQRGSIVSLADDVEPCSREQARYAFTEQGVIVGQHDAFACFVQYVSQHHVTAASVGQITVRLRLVSDAVVGGMGATGRQHRRARGSLARRTLAVSALVSAVIGAAFLVLTLAINTLSDSESRADYALEVLAAANHLERVVIDVETTQRGYIITGDPRLLTPWYQARAEFAQQGAAFVRLVDAADPDQVRRAEQITSAGQSYITDYAIPLVAMAERDPDSARTVAVTEEGKRQVDALRMKFEQFMVREQQIYEAREDGADAAAHRALVASSVSVAGSILLILFSGGYLARSVVRPVRLVSAMAGRVAGGDLSVRMPETGPAEVGGLERSFNSMTDSLETGRDELRRVADEQAALRRVATLVARGVSPPELFGAVAAEAGGVLGVETTALVRFERDHTATVAGTWENPGSDHVALPLDSHWPAEEDSVAWQVQRTGSSATMTSYESGIGAKPDWARAHGIRSSVGSPIVVDGRLWGALIAFSGLSVADPEDTEKHLLAFTELVAMAIANTENKAQLAASRARVVAAADETRRRIERDLHDGTQQRLISLALELRAAEARVPPEQRNHVEQWSRTAQGLTDVIEELRKISRGLHPVILERGGLGPAVRALARRSGLRVELSVQVNRRLPQRAEVAAYYVVSEALANAAKHAQASVVEVDLGVAGDELRLQVRDDGVGGADPSRGSGLIGLSDRVESVGGHMEISSPPRGGTTLLVTIPVKAA